MKWAGNKYRLIPKIQALLPPGKRLIEPFVGSGAVFLNTSFPHYLLADANPDLIHLYNTLNREGDDFIDFCESLFCSENHCAERYYHWREQFNTTQDGVLRAALFIYLNRYGYNGLCRYNKSGGFNVPFGQYKKPYFPRRELLHFKKHSQHATFMQGDYRDVLKQAKPGDVVYCDPPYVPLSDTAHFTAYTGATFSQTDQHTLVEWAERLANRGVSVLISNHANTFTKTIYANARTETFMVRRTISQKIEARNEVQEILALYD